jgi:mono/diheme cytochrome c family protein
MRGAWLQSREGRRWGGLGARIAALITWACLPGASAPAADDQVSFARDVAPILQEHCLRCHQPGNRKGDLSLVSPDDLRVAGRLVPGRPLESGLVKMITAQPGEKPEMPRKGPPLSEAQVSLIRRWIEQGAHWPDHLILAEKSKADRSWWSLQPLAKLEPPLTDGMPSQWSANPIDRFIYAKLAARKLTPNAPADRRTLIRRLSYDLTGLPPTPEEVGAFLADESSDAYERLVERLLASPRYGEQWGRHWLDVVRFGESNGFERNVLINNLWPFRDYVVRSFNEDKPFDRFAQEHLAGDVLAAGDPANAIGTVFLVCGPYDNVGNQDAAAAAVIRADTIDEMLRATGEAFLGLTVGCARCHDHKFDPILQSDYYAMYAAFTGVQHGERTLSASRPAVWAGKFAAAPGVVHVMIGGDPRRKGQAVTAASLSALNGLRSSYKLSAEASESERRLALARWITSKDNPLTPRVLANRLWHYHFGVGIVDTPSDFGYMGGRPTHPELLDWLAGQILHHGWRLKPLHRLIVTSQAYRQASTYRADAATEDAEARLLWRFPPRRLSGEEIRDTMLAVAGKLDLAKAGGPGFRLYKYVEDNVATYLPLDEHGPETYRRALYHQNARAARVDVLGDFDCPDPAAAAPRRAVTTTPLQALAMMNHRFTHDMAGFLAQRVEGLGSQPEQVRQVFLLAYGRQADGDELRESVAVIERHGLRAFCLAVLNSNELIYIR